MKQNYVRRDENEKADGRTDHALLRTERDAECERDLRLGDATARAAGDESANCGRRAVDLAGGNGEQRSRERARIQSMADPTGKQPPFPPRPDQPHGRPAEQRERQRSPDAPVPDQDAQRRAEREPQYRGDKRGGAPARDLEMEKDDAERRPPG